MNLVQCRTKKPGAGGAAINRDPTAKEIRECAKRFLWPELAETKALVVVPLGQLAYEWLTFYQPIRKDQTYTGELSKSGKIAGGIAGPFGLGMGHRIKVERKLYQEMVRRDREKEAKKVSKKK